MHFNLWLFKLGQTSNTVSMCSVSPMALSRRYGGVRCSKIKVSLLRLGRTVKVYFGNCCVRGTSSNNLDNGERKAL